MSTSRYFTIGMAGHIDHGKTALTKALTGVQTDHLKEEQARSISIEPGFAPFIQEEGLEVTIIDVPGHENFIRQMIAGVAGIDMVIVVIAADEGVMPQTKEHLDILSLLGIQKGVVVFTKTALAEAELLEMIVDDTKETLQSTFLQDAPIFYVDSLSNKGIPALQRALKEMLRQSIQTNTNAPFRLPIDHVFTAKGQGVIVRGTVYNGMIQQGDQLHVLPSYQSVRVRQIQRHHKQVTSASEGQRAAMNIGGISFDDVERGDVLVEGDYYSVSDRIDVALKHVPSIQHKVKQRQAIKLHIGTTEIMGRIIFFDRNDIDKDDDSDILCQLQLNNNIVVARGDHFIVRRPTPVETIGGGWVIDANAKKHRFGQQTIEQLQIQKAGSAKERIFSLFKDDTVITRENIIKQAAISENELLEESNHMLEIGEHVFTLPSIFEQVKKDITSTLATFHQQYPMRPGINKAEVISLLKPKYPSSLIDYTLRALHETEEITVQEQFVSLKHMTPTLPAAWEKKLNDVEQELVQQGAEVEKWSDLLQSYQIPRDIQTDFYYYIIQTGRAFIFDDERLISKVATDDAVHQLIEQTNFHDFTLQTARKALQLSRKNLVPLLELLDDLGYTKRVHNVRTWIQTAEPKKDP